MYLEKAHKVKGILFMGPYLSFTNTKTKVLKVGGKKMKGIVDWINEIKKDKTFAEKFEGTKTVSEILSLAKENGYEFSEQDLKDLDLNLVSGGDFIRLNIISQTASDSAVVTGNNSTVISSPIITQNASIQK